VPTLAHHRARTARAALIVAAAGAALAGCRQQRPDVALDQGRLTAELPARMIASIQRPDVSARFEALGTDLTTDPEVIEAASALATKLGDDPQVQAAGSAFVTEATGRPAAVQAIQGLMRSHPDATPAEIGALTQQRIEAVTNGPAFHAAFGRAWDELLEVPEVEAAFHRLGDQVGKSHATLDLAIAAVVGHLDDDGLRRRLTDLNGGTAPGPARATDLFLEHAFSADRLAGFWKDLTGLPAIRDGLRRAAQGLLRSPAFQRDATTFVRTLLTDPTFRARGIDAMIVLLEDRPDEARLHDAISGVLQAPATRKALVALVDQIVTDPALRTVAGDALAPIAKDPALRGLFSRLLTDW
jgi:hypothetical protein